MYTVEFWWGSDSKPGGSVPHCSLYLLSAHWEVNLSVGNLLIVVQSDISLGPHSGMASKKPECMIKYPFHLVPSARKIWKITGTLLYSFVSFLAEFEFRKFTHAQVVHHDLKNCKLRVQTTVWICTILCTIILSLVPRLSPLTRGRAWYIWSRAWRQR